MARRPRLEPRETRLDATHAFLGLAADLVREYAEGAPPRRIRTYSEAAPDDLGAAQALLGGIRDLGIVVHGPIGCALRPSLQAPLAVTDLDERDTVLGSGEALAETVRRLNADRRPAALAVLGSPVVAINNDDIRATVAELSEELGKPVVWVRTDGFRSAVPATGADAAADALLQLSDPGAAPRDPGLLNLLAPFDSAELTDLVDRIEAHGWRVNRLPQGASVADLRRAATAAASLVLEPDTLDAYAEGLERRYGVVRLGPVLPVGPAATAASLRKLIALSGAPAPAPPARAADAPLAGRRIALALPTAWALATADLVADLGGTPVLLAVPHVDRSHAAALHALAERLPGLYLHVGEGQGFETAGLLRRLAPDLLLGGPQAVALALRLGVPAAVAQPSRLVGVGAADHLVTLVEEALEGAALARYAAGSVRPAWTEAWLRRSPDWHIKQEVR